MWMATAVSFLISLMKEKDPTMSWPKTIGLSWPKFPQICGKSNKILMQSLLTAKSMDSFLQGKGAIV